MVPYYLTHRLAGHFVGRSGIEDSCSCRLCSSDSCGQAALTGTCWLAGYLLGPSHLSSVQRRFVVDHLLGDCMGRRDPDSYFGYSSCEAR